MHKPKIQRFTIKKGKVTKLTQDNRIKHSKKINQSTDKELNLRKQVEIK